MGLHGLDRHAGSTQSGEAGMAEFVASAMDESLNKAHVGGLERLLVVRAKQTGKSSLENEPIPKWKLTDPGDAAYVPPSAVQAPLSH
jgi:hypothetical protein